MNANLPNHDFPGIQSCDVSQVVTSNNYCKVQIIKDKQVTAVTNLSPEHKHNPITNANIEIEQEIY